MDLQNRWPSCSWGTADSGPAVGVEVGKLALGGLDLADADVVDPAAAARFQGAFRFAGMPKISGVGQLALETQPYTRVTCLGLHLGRVGSPGDPDNRAPLAEADLVVDATADLGAQQLLSDMSRDAGTAYLQARRPPASGLGSSRCTRPALTCAGSASSTTWPTGQSPR